MCVRICLPTVSLRATDAWIVAGLGIVCCPRRDVCESVGTRGRGDPHGVGVILGDLCGVNVRIGIRCDRWSWNLRGPGRSFATFRVGVVRGRRGVGVGEVVRDVLGVSLSVVLELHASLAVFTERLSSSLVRLLVLDHACTWCSSLLDRRLLWWPSQWSSPGRLS